MPQAALAGIRVIEIGDYLSAGFATSFLADFGADVIKIDLPGTVDNNRRIGGADPTDPERSPQFAALSRNKRSITLDVRDPLGRELFLRLVAESEVLVENFRPGTLERWNLGPDLLLATNADLVLLRISGFGQNGSWRDRPGVDGIAQAFSGLMSVTGFPDKPPVRAGVVLADCTTAIMGALGVVIALLGAQRSHSREGSGQVIDAALFEALVPMLGGHILEYDRSGTIRGRHGNAIPWVTPGGTYLARDGAWVALSATGDGLFGRLAMVIGHPEWLDDTRFVDRTVRYEHREVIEESVARWLASLDADDAVAMLHDVGVPASRVNSVGELCDHPHVRERQTLTRIDDPIYGDILTHAPQPRLSRTPGSIRSPAPRPGEHNVEVFAELLGVRDDELRALMEARVV